MRYYPALLDLRGKYCVVIGGGKVALRKALSLLKAGAFVRVISPEFIGQLLGLKKNKRVMLVKSQYQKRFLKGAFLAIASTDNKTVNHKAARDAASLRKLINVVDSPGLSNFIVPAVLNKKDLIISISTSGKVPCLSRRIKEDLRKSILPQYIRALDLLKGIRRELKKVCPDPKIRESVLNHLANARLTQLNRKQGRQKIRELVRRFSG